MLGLRRLVPRSSFLVLLAASAAAQEPVAPTTLPPVVVTVTRDVARSPLELPFAITRIAPDSLRPGQRNLAADETLMLVPGVSVANRNNPTQDPRIAVRGFGARAAFGVRSVRILRDGIPLTLPDGQTPTDYLDLASVGSVEVIRGSASALYGNAAGGVVDFRSSPPPVSPVSVDLRGLSGSHDLQRWSAGLGGTVIPLRYQALVTRTEQDGYRRYAQQKTTHATGRVLHSLSGTELAWQAQLFSMPVAENPGALTAAEMAADPRQAVAFSVVKRARKEVSQNQLSVTATRPLSAGELTASLYGGTRDLDNPLTFAVVAIDRTTFGGSIRMTSATSPFGKRHRLSAGVDVQRLDDDRKNFENCNGVAAPTAACPRADTVERGGLRLDQREVVTSIGPFVRDEFTIGERVHVHAGLRADYVIFDIEDLFIIPAGPGQNPDDSGRRTLRAWSPMAGVIARVGTLTSAYANISTAFETPTATELGNRPEGAGGINRDLEPQTATTVEVGVKGIFATRLRYDVAGFLTGVQDELIPFEVPGGAGRRYFRNAGRTIRRGLEAGLELTAGTATFASAYSYSDFRFDEYAVTTGAVTERYDDNRIPGIPLHQVQASVTWRWSGLFLTAEGIGSSRVLVDDANSSGAAGWGIANARLGGRIPIGGTTVVPVVGVQNLFNRRYVGSVVINAAAGRYYEPAPERTLSVGLSLATGR
ncbi:MAG TPA: TonB-dependent receptor [Gemmatimonadaceae bacterium]|nr:TonB-dependent receptor [Gemmatimonadaceae bacterium]